MFNNIYFWRAEGCFKSALAITEAIESQSPINVNIRKLNGSKLKPHHEDLWINWGNGGYKTFPELEHVQGEEDVILLNNPFYVNIACVKSKTFKALNIAGVPTLEWTKNKDKAVKWLIDGDTVIARATETGCCGVGITIHSVESGNVTLPDVPLYTKYQKKRHEYRVHVFDGKVIDVVQKKKKVGHPSPTGGKIRNIDDGWVFAHNDLKVKDMGRLHQIGIDAVKACALDFGAVDIIWNESQDKYYVVEVNTAPGLESSTIDKYAEAILTYANTN